MSDDILEIIDVDLADIDEVLMRKDDDMVRASLRESSRTLGRAAASIQARDNEIARLTDALAAAERERDAAVNALELAVNSGDVLMVGRAGKGMTTMGLQPDHGYFVSYPNDDPDMQPTFADAWELFRQHATESTIIIAPDTQPAPPQPDTADAAGAETVTQLLVWAGNSLEHAEGHAALIEDDRARCAAEGHSIAIGHLINVLKQMQKGTVQS